MDIIYMNVKMSVPTMIKSPNYYYLLFGRKRIIRWKTWILLI
jgi:hypothetical protein